jgi:hypothetical protein
MATTGTGQSSSHPQGSTGWDTAADRSSDRRPAGDGSGIAQTLRDTTYRRLDDQKVRASETLGSLAGAVRGMSQPLREGGQSGIADYITRAADGIERWADNLGRQDLDQAVREVQHFARRQPALFLGIAFGTGVMIARFLKSSDAESEYGSSRTTEYSGGPMGSRASGGYTPGAAPTGSTGMGTTDFGAAQFGTTAGDIPRVPPDRSGGGAL